MGFRLPGFGFKMAMLNIPEIRLRRHVFDGQHYWEVNKRGYSQKKFVADVEALGLKLYRSYRVPEVPYHRFFVFNVSNGDESEKSI
ncbi:hypothetical protein KBTX_02534 [wastewater metagenome]|uniref:Uncharacterized protein n=3 Tax=root TaxID=1 RepID=A0A5B8RFB1_9ZZZZ|nr:hypothetical protein KBTEX_02534 [uncultured organism]